MNTELRKSWEMDFNDLKTSPEWPSCFEKSLITCIYFANLNSKNEIHRENFIKEEFDKECDTMLKRLKIEGLESSEKKNSIQSIKALLKDENWKLALEELNKTLKNTRTLNIRRVRDYLIEIDKANDKLNDKDVILFLGNFI